MPSQVRETWVSFLNPKVLAFCYIVFPFPLNLPLGRLCILVVISICVCFVPLLLAASYQQKANHLLMLLSVNFQEVESVAMNFPDIWPFFISPMILKHIFLSFISWFTPSTSFAPFFLCSINRLCSRSCRALLTRQSICWWPPSPKILLLC